MNFDDESGSVALAPPGSVSWDSGGRGLLVDSLLMDQSDLSAVERFAQFHEHSIEPLQGRYYSALLPASPPGPGEQLAFLVDLDRCSGCKACVAACHSLNGLDDGESWRDVGLLVGADDLPPIFRVELAGKGRRVHEVTEHYRELAPFGVWGLRRGELGQDLDGLDVCGGRWWPELGRRWGRERGRVHTTRPDQDATVLIYCQALAVNEFGF